VAASLAPSSRDVSARSSPERFRLIRELGSRAVPTWAALELLRDGRSQLVVVSRAKRGAHSEAALAEWVRTAEHVAKAVHPNLSRVREAVRRADDVLVSSEFVDGVTWAKLSVCSQSPPLEIALRIFVDVLSGLGAIHNLRHSGQELKLIHGALAPECVVVGSDGVARLVSTCALRSAVDRPARTSAYLAPEVLLEDDSADARADVYSVGAMLWEALSGQRLFRDLQASAIVTQLLSGKLCRPCAPTANAWAEPLVDVAMRAMAANPQQRFPTAAAFAAEIRRVAGLKVAPSARVAAWTQDVHGDVIRLRREALERGGARPPEVSGMAPQPRTEDDDVGIDIIVERPSTAPTPMRPAAPLCAKDPHESQVQTAAPRRPPRSDLARLSEAELDVAFESAPPSEIEQNPLMRAFEPVRAPDPFRPLVVPQAPLVPKELKGACVGPCANPSPAAKRVSPPPIPDRDSPAPISVPGASTASRPAFGAWRAGLAVAAVVLSGALVSWLSVRGWVGGSSQTSHAAGGLISSDPGTDLGGSRLGPSGAVHSLTAVEERPVDPPVSSTAAADNHSTNAGTTPPRPGRARVSPANTRYEPEGI
jgi:serine/threonine-protein kinase